MRPVYKVLVTGVGGGVGQSVLRSLENSVYQCVAYDSSPLAAGLYMSDESYLGLNATDPNYPEDVLSAAMRFGCSFIIPGHDIELLQLEKFRNEFRLAGIELVLSEKYLLELADDKYRTSFELKHLGFDPPQTWHFTEFQWSENPVILKPRKGGARSKRTYLASNRREFERYSQMTDIENTVVQEYCPGEEFTCGTLTFEGKFHGSIVMKRELRAGDTYKAFSIKDSAIMDNLEKLCNSLRPQGPCNFQLKLQDGRVRVFEINARFSGTTFLRKLCGFDEVLYTLNLISNQTLPSLSWHEKTILRYWSELMIDNSELKLRN